MFTVNLQVVLDFLWEILSIAWFQHYEIYWQHTDGEQLKALGLSNIWLGSVVVVYL